MTNIALASSFKFPPGTSVAAYPAGNWMPWQRPPTGAPPGSAAETKTVAADGSLTYTTLTDGAEYFAYASVGGTDTYVRFFGASTGNPWIADKSIGLSDVRVETINMTGTLANRPAAAAANNGATYLANDNGLLYASDGSNWNTIKPGQELGYAQITAQLSTTSLSLVDASGLSTTVTVGVRPIMIHAFFPWLTHTVDQKLINAAIIEGSTTISFGIANASGAGGGEGLNVWARRSPAAGSYTYKVQYDAGSAGTAVMWADPTFPAFIRVVEV